MIFIDSDYFVIILQISVIL